MSHDSLIWAYTNLMFLVVYTVSIVPYIIKIPISVNKHILAVLLMTSYISTYDIKATFENPQTALLKSNTYCLLLFLTFPSKILLVPFYFITILNLSAYVIKNRKYYENSKVFEIARKIMQNKRNGYLYCYILEIMMIPICVLLMFIGMCSLLTLLAYCYVVLYEYQVNSIMRNAFFVVRQYGDEYSEHLGQRKMLYIKARDCIIKNFAIKDDEKKNK